VAVNIERMLKNERAIALCRKMIEIGYSPAYRKDVLKTYLNPFKRVSGFFERFEIEVEYFQLMPKFSD